MNDDKEYIFNTINKDKIGALLNLKDKCYFCEMELFNQYFCINNNNWNFIYYDSFFSLVRDVTDLSLFFIINEEISNSIKRKPFEDLLSDIILNKHYKDEIYINGKKIKLSFTKLKHTYIELQDLFVWKYNEILNSQLYDFSISIFSAFENWISILYKELDNPNEKSLLESKKKKIEKLIQQYNESAINNKDKILAKMMKLNSYISFPDKLNSIFSIVDKNEYEKNRDIKKDKEIITFLRVSRNTVHNSGIHEGGNLSLELNGKKYELIAGKPRFSHHIDMILLHCELVDIYANILNSINDIPFDNFIKEQKNQHTFEIFNKFILNYKYGRNNLTEESKNLFLKNLKKIVLGEDKANKILNFLDSHDGNKDTILTDTLSADLNNIYA